MTCSHSAPRRVVARVFFGAASWALLSLFGGLALPVCAQEAPEEENLQSIFDRIGKKGPFTANLGTVARIEVPAGYYFIPKENMRQFNDLYGNSTNPDELGALQAASGEFFVVFEWNDVGFIKDDEKDQLDADAILDSLRQGQEQDNQQRQRMNRPPMQLTGWEQPPFYDPQTNNLTWATRIQCQGKVSINYNSRILGRRGYMSSVLVVEPDVLSKTLPIYKELMKGYAYQEGSKYSEWKPGDKMAAVGLGALITGGAVAVAAKSGLLGKLLKPIIAGIVVVGAAIGAFFKKLFGRGGDTEEATGTAE